ncbi:MAG: D-alanine--D-alanine ligase [Lachnospiraceae bacterium]|nr:D-alanine--D-alanine ligase [Candidatus Colinaster equi]
MKIVVLAGGISTERDVSLVTGANVYEALKKKGHDVIILDVYLGLNTDTEGIFTKDIDWAAKINKIAENNPDIEAVKKMRDPSCKGFFGPNVLKICMEADVVFMALHGENGENGKIQACFDLMNIKYTGTGCTSSAICMNKQIAKEIMAYNGIPVPKGIKLDAGTKTDNTIGYPCVVKACSGGSSVGVYMCENEEEYKKGIEGAFALDNEVLVEECIKGREFSVGVIEGKALPIIEIAPISGFYDYKNKYQAGATIETCPAELDDIKTKQMQTYAQRAFKALRLEGYARMDFLMKPNGEMYCLEANTLPGMTATSLIPQEAKADGIEFGDLCAKIVQLALDK